MNTLLPACVTIPLDADHVHPDALRAAFEVGIDRLERGAELRGDALDWGTFRMTLEPDTTEQDTTRMRMSAKKLA